MKEIKTLTMELANACREKGLNFVVAIEDDGIHSQSSVKGNSNLRQVARAVKGLIKK